MSLPLLLVVLLLLLLLLKTKTRGRHSNAAALHGKTPRRDQNPVLAISSFGPIKTCATRSSSRQNTREPGSLRAGQNNAWMTFAASALHHATRARSTRTQRRARFDAMTPGLRDDSPGCMRDEYSSQQTTKKAVIIMNNKGLCLRGLKACVGKKNDGNQTRTNTKA